MMNRGTPLPRPWRRRIVSSPRPRYWQLRLYLVASSALTILVIWLEQESLGHRIITKSGTVGWYCVAAVGAVCVTAFIDTLINDVFPFGRGWRCARRWRHWVFMALALGMSSLAYVVVMSEALNLLFLPFLLDAAVACSVAITDLFHRYRSEHREIL